MSRKELVMRFRYLAIIFGATIAVSSARVDAQSSGQAVMTPGLWEITVQTRSPIVAAPLTHTVCLDRAHLTRPELPKSKAGDDCQVLPDPAAANQTAYTIRCTKRKVASTVRFTYAVEHFEGAATINTADGEFQQVYSAVRIGDCAAPDPTTPSPIH